LRPPALDELGLSAALSQAVTRLTLGSIAARVEVSDLPALPAALEVAIYRIVSEAVTNLVRHAGASRCAVTLKLDGHTVCTSIVDDGQGMHPGGSLGHGLDTMRERAEELGGRLEVSYQAGTTIRAIIPLGRGDDDHARSGG
jgi:signal transduction histidine kinase